MYASYPKITPEHVTLCVPHLLRCLHYDLCLLCLPYVAHRMYLLEILGLWTSSGYGHWTLHGS